ncbi:alpha/beta hydrolase [Streptomyces sp. CAU 1734]|uniref:alpha/beta hydrolase family protein n=1 Tax=Streptomyces sp. CAU 1734 TaxID=3140360 RepID=UPI0032618051
MGRGNILPHGRRRVLALTAAVVTLIAAVLGGVVVWQHSYDMETRRITIAHGGHTLRAVLTTPEGGRGRHPLVVMVHGDGPVDATREDGYQPLWEAYARAGYATLSWDKPGVNGAPGNWLEQSMDDRADEVAAAIGWARSRPEIDARHIGLWGASQAGWVMPKVAERTEVAFVIAVAPAINWLRQGRFHLLAELKDRGAPAAEAEKEIARSDRVRALLRRGATHREYLAAMGGADGMTEDRWGFIGRNHTADAMDALPALRGVPVLLALGGHDRHVDSADTEAGYRERLEAGGGLTVRHYPDADHTMVDDSLARSEFRLTVTAVLAPRAVFADRFLRDQETFLRNLPRPA